MHWSAEPEHLDEVISRVQSVIASKTVLEIAKGMVAVRGSHQGASRSMTKARETMTPRTECVGVDDDAEGVLRPASERRVRRLPVARALPDPKVGELLQALSTNTD
ncbi:hypothetical protein [Streptomyces prunicolor]|uniref:hypothetical protein n=1 Tax=Streptomyces prunicolor TaxID=67348 RepID=UPI00341859A9